MPRLDITPSKHIFDALIQDINEKQAILDLIDNSIDNWKINELETPLEINISIDENHIVISDNAGGMDERTLPLILKPGGTNRIGGVGVKGIWGVGAKRAIFSLGRNITISTRKEGHRGLVLPIPEDWFRDSEDENEEERGRKWFIEAEFDNSISVGTTKINIENLKYAFNSFKNRKICDLIAKTYKDQIKDGTLQIHFNGEMVEIYPEISWARSEWAPPSKYITEIPVTETDRNIQIEIIVGIMTQAGGNYSYGIDFIGNQRKILENNLDYRMGFESGKLGLPHSTINRFKAVVRVNGDTRDIPWNSSKSSINENHPMYPYILEFIVKVCKQYTTFLRNNYHKTSQLFNERAELREIQEIVYGHSGVFENVVQEYEEEPEVANISFQIPIEEYNELAEYFGWQNKPKSHFGKFIFYKLLKEVKGTGED